MWVEKILDPGERLRDWPVIGTVGYEFLNDVVRAVRRPGRRSAADGAVGAGRPATARPFGEWAAEAKLEQATRRLHAGGRAAGADRRRRSPVDGSPRAVSSLPVYRTYVEPESGQVDATPIARRSAAGWTRDLRAALLLEAPAPAEFVTRFQQTTPAIMAKGVEDTAFYRYCRLLALNDVGGDPSRFGITVEQFHAGNRERAERFPENLLTTQTHDAKRSADVRLRIAALAGDGRGVDARRSSAGWR